VVRLKPLVQYLSASTGLKVTFRASPNMDAAAGDLGNDFTQIAYLTPVAYLDAHEQYAAIPIAAPLIQGRSTFRLVVVVRQDSAFKTMNDLHGQSFAFGDEKALLQRAVVAGGGVSLGSLSRYAFLKHYDNIAKAVLNRDFDAGILKDSIADEFQGKGLRVIYASPPLPSYLFAVNSRLPAATVNKLRQALLALKADNPAQMKVLKSLDERYGGFGPVDDKDYDVIRKLIAPFK
jgi:phosphonate transport system substrate-binding protein